MITTFYPPFNFGGDGIFVQRLSHELARRGHHVEVIHCVDSYRSLATRELTEAYQEPHPRVIVHSLRSRLGWLSPLATQQTGFPLFKSRKIRRILEKGFDVINYHNISLVGGPALLRYGSGIKLYTLHEYWLVCPMHILFKFNRAPCEKKSCLLCAASYKRPPQLWRYTQLMESAVAHVDRFICPDRFTAAKHLEMGLKIPTVHMPHFVPLADRAADGTPVDDSGGRRQECPYFLFVGRLEKLKGLQTVIPVFRGYAKANLLIAGTGTYEPHLRKLAAGSDNIHFLGFQSGAKLDQLYRDAVAVIAPSINYEVAPPLVIMEAFNQKTPAIVRKLGSMPEIIEESGGGLIYETDAQLISALDRLLEDTPFRDLLRQRAYRALQEKWTPDAYLEKYLGLIHELMESRAMSRRA
jgi:glycosyltransferase involved in cell wall biosynthesis